MAGTPGRGAPNKHASEGSPRRIQRNRQQQQQQQQVKIPRSGIVPTALTAAFDHPGIAAAIRKFVFETMQKGITGLRKEFAVLRATPDQTPKVPIDSTTASKFRYKDVYCTDKSRVILTFLPNFGDFIHANWLKSELMDNTFICCQGPLLDSTGDFWRMIYQEKIYHIFMLCRCEEMGKAKCHQYWPKSPGETLIFYGLLTVRNEGVTENDSDICTTSLTLTCKIFFMYLKHFILFKFYR
uniref:Tyrosine-protein phosphatase domain-containing protein n=1 Tax=Panagrolaimus superbus TaxID=310955 RepID=A0A914XUP2_9BILA